MVAKITSPSSLKRALAYNERKLQKGAARCLYAGNFLKDAKDLTFGQKWERFEGVLALNRRAKSTALHISLNFHPSEKLTDEKLYAVATSYMQKIGFGEQPYLLYRHDDAGHPHLHLVTTTIAPNGKRLPTHNIGKNASQAAIIEIEKTFGLIRAKGRKAPAENTLLAKKIVYGQTDALRAITAVLAVVLPRYLYTSLPELNAVLRSYNLMADGGESESRLHQRGGILYKILNETGTPVGVPLKGSAIPLQATLVYLQQRFEQNLVRRAPFAQKLRTAIDWTMAKGPTGVQQLIASLQKENIEVIERKSNEGFLYGITYIDHRTRAIFNGSDLGKAYSAAGIQRKLAMGAPSQIPLFQKPDDRLDQKRLAKETHEEQSMGIAGLLGALLQPEISNAPPSAHLLKKKKKKPKSPR